MAESDTVHAGSSQPGRSAGGHAANVITGNSNRLSAFDFFRVTTAAQPAAGFYHLTLQFRANPPA